VVVVEAHMVVVGTVAVVVRTVVAVDATSH
jgi:hypothetical protein